MSARRALAVERRVAAALLLLALGATLYAAPAVRVDRIEPRPFGYTVGDVLAREVRVEVDRRYALERARLPRPYRVDAWLEARAPVVAESSRAGTRRYAITFTYQVVGAPEDVRTLVLPAVPLEFAGPGGTLEETLPDWPITVGPITPANVLGRAGLDRLRPDRAPVALATRPIALRLAGYAGAAALLLLYLGYCRYGLPWPARAGPFARAWPDLRRLLAPAQDPGAQRAALRRLHRAFDETAGHTVFVDELDTFFAAHPRFAPLRPLTESFFLASRREFYGEGRTTGAPPDPLALCREYRRRERGGR